MPQYLPLPDGSYLKLQEGESPADGLRRAQQKYPEAFAPQTPAPQPQGGFLAAAKAGATELGGGLSALAGKLGLKDEAKAEAEYQAAKKRAAEIFKPTEEGWTEAPVTKFLELLGGSAPYMAAPLAAGAAAATLPVSGPAALAASLGAAGLTSAGQFTATNLARQMEGEEGTMPKKRLAETSLGSAFAAAVPQALLDTAAMRMIPGIGRIFGQAGVKVTAENAKEIAEQGLKKTLADYAAKTGRTAGIEGVTEATQQVFERLQAGLSITDPKARKEYFDSFIGGAVLGGTLAPAGRFVERGREQREARGVLDKQAQEERAAALKAEEERKKDPAYVLGIADEYEALNKQKEDLKAQIVKGTKEAPLTQEGRDSNSLIQKQLSELEPKLKEKRNAYLAVGGPDAVKKMREQQRIDAMTPEEYAEYSYAKRAVPGAPRAAAPAAEEKLAPEFADPLAVYEKGPSQAVLDYVAAQMRTAQRLDQGNFDVNDYVQFLLQDPLLARQVVEERPSIPGVSKEDSAAILDGLKLQLDALGKEIGAGREAAKPAPDVQALLARAPEEARQARAAEELEAEGRAEREGTQGLAQDLAYQQRMREQEAFRSAQQTTLLPEVQERVARTYSQDERLPQPVRNELAALYRELRNITRRPETQEGLPTQAMVGPWSEVTAPAEERDRVRAITQRIAELTRTPRTPITTTESVGIPPDLTPAPIETRPQPKLEQQTATLLERITSSPNVDDDTRALAAQVQDSLPQVVRQLRAQTEATAQRAPQRGVAPRVTPRAAVPQGDELAQIARWAQGVLSGRPSPEVAADLQAALQSLEAGKRSETEQGRRAVQTELDMPEPTAKAFNTPEEFEAYLASDGLAKLRNAIGLVGPTVARLQRFLVPLQQKAAALRRDQNLLQQGAAALRSKSGAERAAGQQLVDRAQQRFEVARAALDSTIETILAARDAAQQKFSNALTEGVSLAQQLVENQRALMQRLDEEAPVARRTPAFGEATTVQKGQSAAYESYIRAKQEFETALDSWMAAETNKRDTVQRNIGKDWSETSTTWGEYSVAKKRLDKSRAELQAARKKMDALRAKVPQIAPVTSDDFQAFLVKEAELYGQLQNQMRRIGGFKTALNKFSKLAGIDAYVQARDNAHFQFRKALGTLSVGGNEFQNAYAKYIAPLKRQLDALAEEYASGSPEQFAALDKAREELVLAEQMQAEANASVQLPEQQAAAMAGVAVAKEREAAVTEREIRARQQAAQERAKQRQPAPAVGETKAEREARDGAQRKAEQERLERQESPVAGPVTEAAGVYAEKGVQAGQLEGTPVPRTLVSFARTATEDEALKKFQERAQAATTAEERAAIVKELDEYLKARIATKDAALDDMKRKAAKNIADLNKQRSKVAELTEKLKGEMTPKRRKSAEQQLEEAKRKLAEHQRRYNLNTREMKVTRTDVQAQRQERKRLLADVSKRRIAGERLGVAEDTQQRATGPVTRPEVIAPKAMRTGSEESRAGATATDTRQKLTEARGEKQRDIPLKASEVAEANRIAAELAKQTPEQKAAAAKEEADVQKEQAKLKPTPTKVKPLSEAAGKKEGKRKVSEVIEEAEEDLYEEPEIEVLGGPEEEVYFTAKRPPMSADARQAARVARETTGMPRIEDGASDSAFYKASGFQPDASAPFQKMTLADAARFGASKARGQRKELFTRLADLFDEATTPEKQGLVFATNGRRNPEGAAGAFYRKSNVIFTPSTGTTNYLETLLHELTHAASWYALSVDKRLAGRVESLRRKAADWAETKEGKAYIRKHAFSLVSKDPQGNRGIYGLKNVDEFLSELYADREFQKFLTQIPSDAPKKNLLTRFVEFMSSFFSAPDQAQQSLFAEAVALSEEVLETTRREIYGTDVALTDVQRSRLPFGKEGPPDVAFSAKLPTAARVADALIAKEKGFFTKLKENFLGMGARTQFVDKLAPTEEALKRGGTDPTKALQAMYYLRMYDQRMHFTSQSITDGVPELVEKTRRDGQTERLIETKAGANIKQIVDILKAKDVVKAAGSADAANKLFTLYLAARRAENEKVGYDKLNFKVSEADIKAARAEIEADPTLKKAFDEARDIYNQYNRNLLEFSVQTGALSREQANNYLRNNDYIPYYRVRDGVAELMIGNETPIRIGNLKDSPHLKELVGGDEAIFDFLTSSVQNTSMLLDMATKNLATKNLMFELRDVGLAKVSKVPKSGKVPEGAVTFKRDGEDHFAIVDTDKLGISSDLLVKGLAGIPTMFPAFVRALGVPARFLRRAVVASPVYMARQLFRDTLAASMTSGANITPVLSALQQIGKPNALQGRGITGGQVFTGMPEDVTRMLKDMQAGKISVTNGLSYLEAKAAQVDALTRKAQYDSYLAQGLSEMEATYMALESMNFSKRGLSPTMHMVSTVIPFFNAQIQGLDVLYKAFTGKMPLNERLAIREKLWTRGMMLAGLSFAYAMAMQDDEAYKNAKPEQKYGNWFVRIPGFDEPVRLPIPFELGYVFKSLPEALVNIAMRDDGAEEAQKALRYFAQQMIPGGSSYMIPQAVKPALETLYGKSLYTGRDIESTRERMVEPGYRYRDNTTALAREIGELTGFSPIKLEYLINGYTGSMGMALLAALSAPFGKEGPEAATKRASDLPVVGTLFQANDASGIIDATYERMNEVNRVKKTYEDLLTKGRQDDAAKYLNENIDKMALASVAGSFTQFMGQITEFERQIRASNMTPDQKREQLDKARQAKIKLATSVRAMADKKERQAAPA